MSKAVPVGTIMWQDLTIPDAESVRDFYRQVVGWEFRGEEMGGYEDFHQDPAGAVCALFEMPEEKNIHDA